VWGDLFNDHQQPKSKELCVTQCQQLTGCAHVMLCLNAVHCRVANSLVSAYEAVFGLLDDPTAGYAEQGGSAVVKHTPAQVRTILGVL
jgi:hypothetical protein